MLEPLIGSPREIARRWAEQYQFPMAPYERDRLPDVAQYLAVNAGEYDFPRRELGHYLHQELVRRHFGGVLPDDLRRATLEELLTVAWKRLCARNPDEPHAVLARLPFPVYISTTPNNLLAEALIAGREAPRGGDLLLERGAAAVSLGVRRRARLRPQRRAPLIYHLFGHLRQPESVVVAEDDFFDYLIGVTGNKDLIPPVVRRARTDSALLFLGFQLDDWDFRVLFRSIMGQEGRTRRKRYAHVAAQIDPEEERILEPGRARKYLESYFEDADVSIYWGDAVEFLQEMWRRWSETAEPAGTAESGAAGSSAVAPSPAAPGAGERDALPNPYVGPRPFETGERLFGRDREARELLDLFIAERIVLLHSPSGAGKTSLLRAALIPRLRDEGFSVLPVARVNTAAPPDAAGGHEPLRPEPPAVPGGGPAAGAAAAARGAAGRRPRRLPGSPRGARSADRGDRRRGRRPPFPGADLRPVRGDPDGRPEETAAPGGSSSPSSAPSCATGGAGPCSRCARTTWGASTRPCCASFRRAWRRATGWTCWTWRARRRPITGPRRGGRPLHREAAGALVDDLARVRVQQPDGSVREQPGQYVEPVQLQVVCQRLWENGAGRWEALPAGQRRIAEADLAAVGDVDSALTAFYAECVRALAGDPRMRDLGVRERDIREWFDRHLITPQGIRGQVPKAPGRTQGLANEAIEALIAAHLVRQEERRGLIWYELTHDRLMRPIQADNAAWLAADLAPLQRHAGLWADRGRAPGLLLRDADLREAERWAADGRNELREVEREFLGASQAAQRAVDRERRTTRTIRGLGVGAMVLFAVSAILAYLADGQAGAASARQLAAQAVSYIDERPDLALLLSFQALRLEESVEARGSLLSALEDNPRLHTFLRYHQGAVWATAFSANGYLMASGGDDQTVILWDMGSERPLHKPLQGHSGSISALAFGLDSSAGLLASGSADGTVRLWETETGVPPPGHRWRWAGASSVWPSARTGAPWPPPAGRGRWCCGTSRTSSPGPVRCCPAWAAARCAAWPSARTGAPWPPPATTAPSGSGACGPWRRPAAAWRSRTDRRSPATTAGSGLWPSARTGGCWRPRARTARCACGTRPAAGRSSRR